MKKARNLRASRGVHLAAIIGPQDQANDHRRGTMTG
jgi:hypothetical protein